jgi:hypothetical protein
MSASRPLSPRFWTHAGARLVVFGPIDRRECGQTNRPSKRELGGRGRSRFRGLAVVSWYCEIGLAKPFCREVAGHDHQRLRFD